MAIASRYIGGIPYDPSMQTGRYPNRASVGTTPGIVEVPGVVPRGADPAGGGVTPAIVQAPLTGGVAGGGGGGSGGGGNNLLASLLLGGLGAAPLIYDQVSDWFEPAAPPYEAPDLGSVENMFDPGGSFLGPGGVSIPTAALGGFGTNWNSVFEPGSWTVNQAGTDAILNAPMPTGDQFAGLAGDVAAGTAGAGALANAGEAAALTPGLLESGELVFGGVDVGSQIASLPLSIISGIAGNSFGRRGNPENAAWGTAAGSALASIGAAMLPTPLAPIGLFLSAIGPAAGGAIGSQIGPPPTVGRNFSSFGTFGGDGNLHWGSSGGDNGASALDADPFANWFAGDLFQQAADQGLQFNPNMAGA
ncbi:hypothetical protein GXW78_06020 [Roseomonas terrae]|uniref:Tail fiber protein n=1 Tax=Neoroseomonas terrae TaxID=424799 RepID=A0ABS5EDW0_9PROT|nr:hypothetical protein [Neoroseomonas terrae]MBR0649210.1 hypothetical protein [Neoroseomonas terrae]